MFYLDNIVLYLLFAILMGQNAPLLSIYAIKTHFLVTFKLSLPITY